MQVIDNVLCRWVSVQSCVLQVLQHLGYLSKRGVVQLKGRVACEAHTQEMIVTELFFRNTLSDFEPAEVAALLSSLVLQQVTWSLHYTCSCYSFIRASV